MTAMGHDGFAAPVPTDREKSDLLDRLGRMADLTGRSIVDLAGFLDHVDQEARLQAGVADEASAQARDLVSITDHMRSDLTTVRIATEAASSAMDGSLHQIKAASDRSRDVATWVDQLGTILSSVDATLAEVRKSNADITTISKQINILAINAKIEAARAGPEGKGFSVVAQAINDLSRQTSTAAEGVEASTRTLSRLISDMRSEAVIAAKDAQAVLDSSTTTDASLSEIEARIRSAVRETAKITEDTDALTKAICELAPTFGSIAKALNSTAKEVTTARRYATDIIDSSEKTVQLSVLLGGASAESIFIDLVRGAAGDVGRVFEAGIAEGRITLSDLFNRSYDPIPGTDPQQMMAAFTTFTDRVLPPIQEPMLARDPRIIFCAAVDTNGYLPTHNLVFSKTPGTDPVWNAANCRNRRMFNDRVGLKSGRSADPFLVQTYRRDMGGGHFNLMKDISAPIIVKGRHWGGLRLAFKPGE